MTGMMLATYSAIIYSLAATASGMPVPGVTNDEVFRGWVPEPKERGTFRIIIRCGFTLVLCVWTAIHPDVLADATCWRRCKNKMGWMLVALLTPDIVVMHAYDQWQEARHIHKLSLWLISHPNDTQVPKTKSMDDQTDNYDPEDARAPVVNRFTLAGKPLPPGIFRDLLWRCGFVSDKSDHLGMEGAFFFVMGGYTLVNEQLSKEIFEEYLRRGGFASNQLRRKDVMDKGNADALGKILVCIQSFCLVIQIIGRKKSNLPISPLELYVVIQVLITILLYFFWFKKPLDVSESINLDIVGPLPPPTNKTCIKKIRLLDFADTLSCLDWSSRPSTDPKCPSPTDPELPLSSIDYKAPQAPTINLELPSNIGIIKGSWGALVFYLLYAALHATEWTSQFPTAIESFLWKASCIVVGTVPVGLLFHMCMRNTFCKSHLGHRGFFHHALIIIYVMGSVFLLVESFFSLRRLPSGVYETMPWENYLPYF